MTDISTKFGLSCEFLHPGVLQPLLGPYARDGCAAPWLLRDLSLTTANLGLADVAEAAAHELPRAGLHSSPRMNGRVLDFVPGFRRLKSVINPSHTA